MPELAIFKRGISWVLMGLLVMALVGLAAVYSQGGNDRVRFDVLEIDIPSLKDADHMPPVTFLHDRHTDALEDQNGCRTCHLQEKGRFVFKFKRLKEGSTENDMAVFHDNCGGCHREKAGRGQPSGPLAAECRRCHSGRSTMVSGIQPLVFDKSLHHRHSGSEVIAAQTSGPTTCAACHHRYDESAQKIVYKKGQEASCRYCHQQKTVDDVRSFKRAAHSGCVACHQALKDERRTSGPVVCRGCHQPEYQDAVERLQKVPRLKRSQPDAVMMFAPLAQTENEPATPRVAVKPVAFNHVLHERHTPTCRACHHASLEPCRRCHTAPGSQKGEFVSLEAAMHQRDAGQSCLGCHRSLQTQPDCAGCHRQLISKRIEPATCERCHAVDQEQVPALAAGAQDVAAAAEAQAAKRRRYSEVVAEKHIPQTVTIDRLVDKYEAVALPHRQIVLSLNARIRENRLAAVFHDRDTTLCQGCHHNSPASLKPPACITCHTQNAFNQAKDDRPALKAAYHQQCMTCHQAMHIEAPAATDCLKCHQKRTRKSELQATTR